MIDIESLSFRICDECESAGKLAEMIPAINQIREPSRVYFASVKRAAKCFVCGKTTRVNFYLYESAPDIIILLDDAERDIFEPLRSLRLSRTF